MDLTSEVFTSILSPIAAFLPPHRNTGPDPSPPTTITTVDSESASDINSHQTTLPPGFTGKTPQRPCEDLTEWQTSPTNPQSRLDSLEPLPSSSPSSSSSSFPEGSDDWATHWQIDGADPTGTRFYATPNFALDKPPLRVDVYLPPAECWPAGLRAVVKPEEAIYRQGLGVGVGGGVVGGLCVGRWLGRVLRSWARGLLLLVDEDEEEDGAEEKKKEKKRGLEKKWWDLPFGSFISVSVALDSYNHNHTHNAGAAEMVRLVPDYKVEQGMLPLQTLQKMWEAESLSWDGVAVVDWERLRFKRQVHEVISLVAVDGLDAETDDEKLVVFKSVLSPHEQRYMYNELKMLLLLGNHENVISRPLGVVTKKGRFGNRRGVCGFLLAWYPLGSLRERLLREDDDYCVSTSMAQRIRWARQVARALAHVNGHDDKRVGFYPDLKPDNIVLGKSAAADTGMLDAVLIDLEQRGGWFTWSPPEVAYVEYLEIVAAADSIPLENGLKSEIVKQLRKYYDDDPDWSPGDSGRQRYYNAESGFSRPWLALLRERKAGGTGRDLLERAQVFMLGKLLWCIFEGQPMVRCGIDHEVLRDADPDYKSKRCGKARAFPEFKQTPPGALRSLIRACTAGAPEWEEGGRARRRPGVVLRQGKLYPAVAEADLGALTAEDTRDAARRFWRRELACAREFMEELLLFKRGTSQHGEHQQERDHDGPDSMSGLLDQVRTRPLLSEVLAELERIERCLVR